MEMRKLGLLGEEAGLANQVLLKSGVTHRAPDFLPTLRLLVGHTTKNWNYSSFKP